MKSLIATVVLLSLVIVLAVLNLHFVNSVVEDLYEMLDALPSVNDPHCIDRATEIEKYWKEKETLLGLTVSYPFVDRVGEQATLLVSTAKTMDLYGFESAKALLYDATEDMRRTEQFSAKNLL